MYGIKIFAALSSSSVEYDCNAWLKNHNNIIIKEFEYRVNESCEHSIAILYEVRG